MVLKMGRPRDMEDIRTHGDLLKCYAFLQKSPSIGKNVQTELVQDFITMLDSASEICDGVYKDLRQWRDMTQVFKDYEAIAPVLADLRTILDPLFDFFDLHIDLPVKLNVMDKEAYGGLLSYIPMVEDKLEELLSVVNKCIETRSSTHHKA